MPIYSFHCEKCGKTSEVLIEKSKLSSVVCPDCGSRKMKKLLSGGSNVFIKNDSGGGGCSSCCSGGSCGI